MSGESHWSVSETQIKPIDIESASTIHQSHTYLPTDTQYADSYVWCQERLADTG